MEESAKFDQGMSKSTYVPGGSSKAQKDAQDKYMASRLQEIDNLAQGIQGQYVFVDGHIDIIDVMDHIEKVITACGGEKKVTFLEVSSTMIRVQTRMDMDSMLFPFLDADDPNNVRFNRKVTELLVTLPEVYRVRWVASPSSGSILIVTLKEGL